MRFAPFGRVAPSTLITALIVTGLFGAGASSGQPFALDAPEGVPTSPGFPNVAQTPGALLSGLNEPNQGRTAIIAYHNGVLFTLPELPSSQPGSDFQVRTWDISDPVQPLVLATHGISPMPVNAHGYFKSGDYLVVGSNWPPEAPWSFRADGPGNFQRTEFPDLMCAGVRGCLFGPWLVDQTFWSYSEVGGNAEIRLDWVVQSSWDHLGLTGVVGHPFLLGDLLIFASDQSRTGVATYDVSDPTNPILLDVLTTGGPGGYWPELWAGGGKLYVVFPYRTNGNGMRVVDVTDPTELRFIADTPLPGAAAMYAQFQDDYAFIGDHKIDMRTFESVLDLDGANVSRPGGGVGVDTSQFALPLGNLLVTGGVGENQGMAIWAHQAEPDTLGPSVAFHIPQAGRSGYPVSAPISLIIHETLETPTLVNGTTFIVRPLGGSPISGRLSFAFDDVLTFVPDQPLMNDTTYEVVLPADGIRDAAGNGMIGYSYTFSTGSSVGGNAPPELTTFNVSTYPAAPGQNVTFTASGSDPNSDPLEYRFDFGDGSPRTAWSSATSANHSYAENGHFRAVVQVRDTSGVMATDTQTVTVVTAPSGPRPTSSGPIHCDDSSRRAWLVHPDNDTVAAVGLDSLTPELEVAACGDPRSIALAATGELWVTCHDDDRIAILDSSTGALLTTLATGYGSAPQAVAVSPNGATAFVTLEGRGELVRFNTAGRAQTGSLALGPRPRALAVSPDGGRVLVTRFLSPKDHAEVWDVNGNAMTLNETIRIRKFGGDENRDGTASGRGVANYLTSIAFAPDGQSAWLTANKPNTERGPFFFADIDLDSDNTVRNLALEIDLTSRELAQAIDLDNSDSASGLAFSPLGDYLFVALQGNNEVIVLDTLLTSSANGLGSLVTRLGTGLAPQGLCVDPTTRRVFAKNFTGRSVTALETDSLFVAGNISIGSSEIPTVGSEALSADVLLGKQIFYNSGDPRMSAEGYLSCATCHLDGGQDGRTWDFTGRGEGFRNTASLRGRSGLGHGNVHWTANFDEIQDFEHDIRGAFGGSGFLTESQFAATNQPLGPLKSGLSPDLDALAAYVSSLDNDSLPRSPLRTATGTLTAQAIAGRSVFASEGCATCHAGPSFTDSQFGPTPTLHDVGTLRTTSGQRLGASLTGIDTPTLLGVWNTAPYFHDGSAVDLDAVFRVAGGTVVQAETGSPSSGASIVDQWVHLNNDDTVHGRAYVGLDNTGARVTFSGVDGGTGGQGAIELRYSVWNTMSVEVIVNGVSYPVVLNDVGNEPRWRHTNWGRARVENIALNAGPANTVEITTSESFPNISIDDVLITTPNDRTAAQPHRRVQALSGTDRANLIAYLQQLDGRSETGLPNEIFTDGFESGTFGAWSAVNP